MAVVRSAAAAEHVKAREPAPEVDVSRRQVVGVAGFELGGFVELDVALGRGVGPHATEAVEPGTTVEHIGEVARVGAVHHVVERVAVGGAVGRFDRVGQRHSRRQATVGLDGERDHHRKSRALRGAGDTDRLIGVTDGHRGGDVDRGAGHAVELERVVCRRLVCGHRRVDPVAVASRPDRPADEERLIAVPRAA